MYWPEGKSCAVLVTVNLDGERGLLAQHPELVQSDKTLSTLRYGIRRGVTALQQSFDAVGIPATWFVPGTFAAGHPEMIHEISQGHEVGMRADDLISLSGIDRSSRRDRLQRGLASFDVASTRPRGFRLPCGEWPQGLADDLIGLGFAWSSSFTADDLPFMLLGSGGQTLVELPFHYSSDDRQAFEWNFSPAIPAGHSRIAGYDAVLENWIWEFDAVRAESCLYVLTLHPHVMATPGRLPVLHEFLAHMSTHSDVWFATGAQIAEYWRSRGIDRGDKHPASVFLREAAWDSF